MTNRCVMQKSSNGEEKTGLWLFQQDEGSKIVNYQNKQGDALLCNAMKVSGNERNFEMVVLCAFLLPKWKWNLQRSAHSQVLWDDWTQNRQNILLTWFRDAFDNGEIIRYEKGQADIYRWLKSKYSQFELRAAFQNAAYHLLRQVTVTVTVTPDMRYC